MGYTWERRLFYGEYLLKIDYNQGRIKVGAIDAAALGPFLK